MFKKIKSKRGMTLVEVLTVVALLAIMLGLAVPNLLAESQEIELAAMNGYARSVAVAVQSRLYGMRNAGTSATSYYRYFKDEAACDVAITTAEGNKTVQYVSNFGEKGTEGKQYLFSRALTDTELLQNGKIVVVYDSETANVLETFYSENDFDIESLFPTVSDDYLKSNLIGVYLGEGAPAPATQTSLPTPSVIMENGEELVANIYIPPVDERLLDQEVALEVFISDKEGKQAMIYGEGFYKMSFNPVPLGTSCKYNIDADQPLRLGDIQGKTLKFAVDSIVLTGVPNIFIDMGLLHSTSGVSVFCEKYPTLFPRASLLNQWLLSGTNSHYAAWIERTPEITADTLPQLNVGDDITIEVVMYALTDGMSDDGKYREFYDDNEEMLQIKSDEGLNLRKVSSGTIKVNGFFESASECKEHPGKTEVKISCIRHLQNLCFDGSMWTFHGITNKSDKYCARLMKDIGCNPGDSWYDLLHEIRAELIEKYDDYVFQTYGMHIKDKNIYPEDQIRFGGALRRLGGDKDFVFEGDGHTISGLCINAIAVINGPDMSSTYNEFFKDIPTDYRTFFTDLMTYINTGVGWTEDAGENWKYMINWFHNNAKDCIAVFPLRNCKWSDIQDDQTAMWYVEANDTYVNE